MVTKEEMNNFLADAHVGYLEPSYEKEIKQALYALIEQSDQHAEPQGEMGELITMLDKMAKTYVPNAATEELQDRAEVAVDQIKSLLQSTANSGLSRQRRVTRTDASDLYSSNSWGEFHTKLKELGIEVVEE